MFHIKGLESQEQKMNEARCGALKDNPKRLEFWDTSKVSRETRT
jgi:hypothetical protein